MKAWVVHYKNKYPGCKISVSDSAMDVWDADGQHVVALRRDGHGNLVCQSEDFGCVDRHDLAPIPRQSRLYKLTDDDQIVKHEDHDSRAEYMASASALMAGEKVKSVAEVGKNYFDAKENFLGGVSAKA